jgi:hypothetical protein
MMAKLTLGHDRDEAPRPNFGRSAGERPKFGRHRRDGGGV